MDTNNYLFSGITYKKNKANAFREIGLRVIWEDSNDNDTEATYTFLEGNLDMFLFGKMN